MGDVTFTNANPEEGEETVASCAWTGDPEATVTWLKDGEVLDENMLPQHIRITMLTKEGRPASELQFDPVELEDAGQYTCNVSNPIGFDFQMKRLEVQGLCVCVCVCVCVCTSCMSFTVTPSMAC